MIEITDELIAEWEAERGNGMMSSVGEYTPEEFWWLLDEVKRLRADTVRQGATGELVLTQQALMQIVDYVLADEPSCLPRTSSQTKAHIRGRLAQLASEIGV